MVWNFHLCIDAKGSKSYAPDLPPKFVKISKY